MSGVDAVLLAAGSASRFGGGKLLAPLWGRPLIEHALAALREAPVERRVAVVGLGEEALGRICTRYGVEVVENPRAEEGMSTSVRRGLEVCGEAEAVIFALADQPLIGPEAYGRLVEAHHAGAEIAVATYGGRWRNPALFGRGVWALLGAELHGDRGAKVAMANHPELVTGVACDDVADPFDVDTVEELAALRSRERKRA